MNNHFIKQPNQVTIKSINVQDNHLLSFTYVAIFFAQLFGLFPIDLKPKDPTKLTFKWKSFRSFFSLLTIFTSASTSIFVLHDQITAGPLSARNVIGFIFFSSCCYIAVMMFRTSMKWRTLMVQWMKTESIFTCKSYAPPKSSWCHSWPLRRRLLVTSIVYITLAIIEHLWSVTSGLNKIHQELIICNKTTDVDYAELFILMHLNSVLKRMPFKYNHFIGTLLEYYNTTIIIY